MDTLHLNILVKNITFNVTPVTNHGKELLDEFSKRFNTYDYSGYDKKKRRRIKVLHKTFRSYSPCDNTYRFIKTTFNEFLIFIKGRGITSSNVSLQSFKKKETKKAKMKMDKKFKMREDQMPVLNQALDEKTFIKLIPGETGFGKTVIACKLFTVKNKRLLIMVKGGYVSKWIEDIKEKTTDKEGTRLGVFKGKDGLIELMEGIENNTLDLDVIIISNKTINNYIKTYEEVKDASDLANFPYPVLPQNFIETMDIESMLVDECHEEFYITFRTLMYFNVNYFLGLTATLTSNDNDIRDKHNLMFPLETRVKVPEEKKKVHVLAVQYEVKDFYTLRYKLGSRGYNHNEFENCLFKNLNVLNLYYKMVLNYVKREYLQQKEEGDKLAVFFSSVDMCTYMTKRLRKDIKGLSIERYAASAGDPYENVIDPDIRVTTVQSSGTAIDIPDLTTVIQTINVFSEVSNRQTIGRLREIRGKELKFIYLWTRQIDAHVKYHIERKKVFAKKAISYDYEFYNDDMKVSNF